MKLLSSYRDTYSLSGIMLTTVQWIWNYRLRERERDRPAGTNVLSLMVCFQDVNTQKRTIFI